MHKGKRFKVQGSRFKVQGSRFKVGWLVFFIFLEIASNRNPQSNREP